MAALPVIMEGEVTSQCESPNIGMPIGLAIIRDGRRRMGEKLIASSPVTGAEVQIEICDPVFIDPEGERLRG